MEAQSCFQVTHLAPTTSAVARQHARTSTHPPPKDSNLHPISTRLPHPKPRQPPSTDGDFQHRTRKATTIPMVAAHHHHHPTTMALQKPNPFCQRPISPACPSSYAHPANRHSTDPKYRSLASVPRPPTPPQPRTSSYPPRLPITTPSPPNPTPPNPHLLRRRCPGKPRTGR